MTIFCELLPSYIVNYNKSYTTQIYDINETILCQNITMVEEK